MAKVFANTLKGPHRQRVESMVLSALDDKPQSDSWDVFILEIPGRPGVYVSIETPDTVLKSWLFDTASEQIRDRIHRDLC